MTQSQFASLHSITIGTVKRWWKKGYLVGNKAINGRVLLTGKYTKEGQLALCGERDVLADEGNVDHQTGQCSVSSSTNAMAGTLRAIAGQLVDMADKLEKGKEAK